MGSWGSYSSIFNLGHRAIKDLLSGDVNVEEKIDGSQFSFGLVEASPVDVVFATDPLTGVDLALKIRSKGAVMHIDAPEKMFNLGAETVKRLATTIGLKPGWTYRGEFLARPKHNALSYDRVPPGNIILFDINSGEQEYLSYEDKVKEAYRLGLDVVPRLFKGRISQIEDVRRFLASTSILGGQQVEGVVIKPTSYNLYGLDKKVLMGKFVSEAFKEVHRKSWGAENPANKDVVAMLITELKQPARWNKAITHLRESGKLLDDVRDIGPLIREIPEDIKKEEEDYIKAKLFAHAWPQIKRGVTAGFAEYYKELLLKSAFETEPSVAGEPTAISSSSTETPQELVGDGGVQHEVHSGVGDIPVDNLGSTLTDVNIT